MQVGLILASASSLEDKKPMFMVQLLVLLLTASVVLSSLASAVKVRVGLQDTCLTEDAWRCRTKYSTRTANNSRWPGLESTRSPPGSRLLYQEPAIRAAGNQQHAIPTMKAKHQAVSTTSEPTQHPTGSQRIIGLQEAAPAAHLIGAVRSE